MVEKLSNESFNSPKDPQKVADRIKEMLVDRTLSPDEIAELNAVAEKLAISTKKVIQETVSQLSIFLTDPLLEGPAVEELKNKLNSKSLNRNIVLDDKNKDESLIGKPYTLNKHTKFKSESGEPIFVTDSGNITLTGNIKTEGNKKFVEAYLSHDKNRIGYIPFENIKPADTTPVQTQAQAPTENLSKLESGKKEIILALKNILLELNFVDKKNKQGDIISDYIIVGNRELKVIVGKDSGKFYLAEGYYILDKDGKQTKIIVDNIKTKDSLSIDEIINIVKKKQDEVKPTPAVSSDRIPAEEYSEKLKENFKKFGLDKTNIDLLKSYGLTAKYEGESKSTNERVDIKIDKGSIEYTKNTEQKYSTSAISLTSDRSNNPNYKLVIQETKSGELYIKMSNENSTFEHYIKKPILQQIITAPDPTPASKPPEGTLTIDQLNMDNFKVGDKLNLQLLNDLTDFKKGTFEHSQLERRLKGVSTDDLIKKCLDAINKLTLNEKNKLLDETQNKIEIGEPTNELPYLLSAFLIKYKLPIVSSGSIQPQLTQKPSADLEKQKGNNDYFYLLINELSLVYNSSEKLEFTHELGSHRVSISEKGFIVYDKKNNQLKADGSIKTDKSLTYLNKDELKKLLTTLNKPTSIEDQKTIEITQSATAEFQKLGIDLKNGLNGEKVLNFGNKRFAITMTEYDGTIINHFPEKDFVLSFSTDKKIDFKEGTFQITNNTGKTDKFKLTEMNTKSSELFTILDKLRVPSNDITFDNNTFTIKTQSLGDISISVSEKGFVVFNGQKQLNNKGKWENFSGKPTHIKFVDIKNLEKGITSLITATTK